MATVTAPAPVFAVADGADALAAMAPEWDALAAPTGSPFVTAAWLVAWAHTRADAPLRCVTLRAADGTLRAGAALLPTRAGLRSPTDEWCGAWDVVAAGDEDRRALWRHLAGLGARRLDLAGMAVAAGGAAATDALRRAGYGVLPAVIDQRSPYVALPGSFDALLAACSKNHRKDYKRRGKVVARTGELRLRFAPDGDLEADLDTLLRLEASGWKGRQGTAIRCDPSAEALVREFAAAAAERGWLRIPVLELDGEPIAASLVTVLGGVASGIKAGYDERFDRLAPGVLLHAEVLRACIAEGGIHTYDFLGAADADKLRWTRELRPLGRIVARRGATGRARGVAWNAVARPALVRARDEVAARRELRARLIAASRAVEGAKRRVRGATR